MNYRELVRQQASGVFPPMTRKHAVEVYIDYFHTGRRRVDMDNVSKVVLDALNGVAYADDRQVRHQYSRAHSLTGLLFLPDGSVDLIKPLAKFSHYVFVRVRDAIE